MKNFAILLGRGIEGCGVTQCAVQLHKKTGYKIFSVLDKKWARSKAIKLDNIAFSCLSKEALQPIIKQLNEEYDGVIIHSVPSTSHPKETQENFLYLIKQLTNKKILINVDHKAKSISRNAFYKELCENSDLLLTHSLHNYFSDWVKKNNIATKVAKFDLGFDYDAHRQKYWKPIEQQRHNVIMWIGRLAHWKGPSLISEFHEKKLEGTDFITILEGLEASIGYKDFLYNKTDTGLVRKNVVNYFRLEKEYGDQKFTKDLYGKEEKGKLYYYPPYINEEAMERLSLSAFGSDLYFLEPQYYGNNIENCHAEVVASGTVPIFHKHFCDHIIHKVQGKPVTECKNSGTIGLDYTNFDECVNTLGKLKKDIKMRDEYREMAFEFWKQHCDIEITTSNLLQTIGENL